MNKPTSSTADAPGVDFANAFATPHRLTVCLPDSSDKTLLDVHPSWLRIAWSYDDLRDKPLATFVAPKTAWDVHLKPEVDGHAFSHSRWARSEGWLPVLENTYEDGAVTMHIRLTAHQTHSSRS